MQPTVPLAIFQLRLGEEKKKRLAAEAKAEELQAIIDRLQTEAQADCADSHEGLNRYMRKA